MTVNKSLQPGILHPDKSRCSNSDCPLRDNCARAVPVTNDLQWFTRFEYRLETNGKHHEFVCDHQIYKKQGT